MARLSRLCPPDIPQHIIQRGNGRQVCFASDVVSDICTATNKGLVLGKNKFIDEVAALTGRRVKPRKRGPKAKNNLEDGGGEFLL